LDSFIPSQRQQLFENLDDYLQAPHCKNSIIIIRYLNEYKLFKLLFSAIHSSLSHTDTEHEDNEAQDEHLDYNESLDSFILRPRRQLVVIDDSDDSLSTANRKNILVLLFINKIIILLFIIIIFMFFNFKSFLTEL